MKRSTSSLNMKVKFVILSLLFSQLGFAQTQEGAKQPGSSGSESLKFKTDGDLGTKEVRDPIQFKLDEKKKATQSSEELTPDEKVFVAYPGYPKHRLLVALMPTQVNSQWKYSGLDFNFKNNATAAMGFSYQYFSTPMTQFSFDYSRYTVESSADRVTPQAPALPIDILKSDVTVDNFGVKSQFCKILDGSFFQRFCWGLDLGVESYPLLDFTGNTTLELTKVQDVVFGINIGYNLPLFSGILLRTKAGYNMGTGSGSSGSLSIKSNNVIYGMADLEWMFKEKHGLTAGVDFRQRRATVSGQRGSTNDKWDSVITTTALRGGYIYNF